MIEAIVDEMAVAEIAVAEMAAPRPAAELTLSVAIAISTTRVLVRIALTPYKLHHTSLSTASKLCEAT